MMRLRHSIFLLVAACSLSLFNPLRASAAPSFASGGELAICTDSTFPPMEYVAHTGDTEPVGFDVDLMKALADAWSAKLKIVTLDFSGLLPALEAKRCDAVVSGIFLTPERIKSFDGVAYLSTASVLAGKGDTAPIKSTDELSGKSVAVQQGTEFVKWMDKINADLAAKNMKTADALLYPKASDVIQQVLIGRAFAGFTQDTELSFRSLQNPGQLSTVYTFPDRQKFAIYIRRNGSDIDEVKKTIDTLRGSGALAGIIKKWNTGGFRGLRLGRLDARHAAAAVDADRHVAIDGGPAHDAVLITIIVDGIVLCRAVVPDRDVTGLPAPPHGVFRRGDVRLEQIEQLLAVIFRQTNEALNEIAEHQRPFAGLRMHAHHRMLGLVNRAGEHLLEMLPVRLSRA